MRIPFLVLLTALLTQLTGTGTTPTRTAVAGVAPSGTVVYIQGACTPARGDVRDFVPEVSGRTAIIVGDYFVQKLDTTRGKAVVVGTNNTVGGDRAAFHPNRITAFVASSRVGEISVVDVHAAVPRRVLRVSLAGVKDLALSPDGRYLYVVGSTGASTHYLRIYRVVSQTDLRLVGQTRLTAEPRDLVVARDGRRAAVTAADRVTLLDLRTAGVAAPGPVVRSVFADATTAAFSPDARTLYVSQYGAVHSIDALSGRALRVYSVTPFLDPIGQLVVGPGSGTLWAVFPARRAGEDSRLRTAYIDGPLKRSVPATLRPTSLVIVPSGPMRNSVFITTQNRQICGLRSQQIRG